MVSPVKVFVSYSWDVERDTGIVDELEEQCLQCAIQLIRDNNTLLHGGLIQEFMDQLSGGEHIITVFSESYFRSKWCMYELLSTWRKGDFKDRTHPIILDGCNLNDDEFRIGLTDFWEGKYKALKARLDGRDPIDFIEEQNQVKWYRDIYQNINELLNFAVGRVITPLEQLKEQHYSQFLDRIKPEKAKDGYLPDAKFLEEIKKYLALDLKKSELFRDKVIQNCGLSFTDAIGLNNYLIEQCVKGGFVQVIQNLQSAFVDSFDELDDSDILGIRKLYQAAEDTLSKLVLFNVKNDWMAQYSADNSQGSHYEHALPEMSFGGVEVVMSRNSQSIPHFQLSLHDYSLQAAKGVTLEMGFRSNEVVRDIIKRLYHRVMDKEINHVNEEHAIEILNKTIQQRKKQKNLKLRKNYFLLMPNDPGSVLADKTVQGEIKKSLPDLSFIHLKSGEVEETFIVEDDELMVAISEFYKSLEECKLQ